MKAEKKLTIKVKSKTEQRIMEDPQVEMVTEWNIKRIAYALIVLLVLVVLPAYYFTTQDENSDIKIKKDKPIKEELVLKKHDPVKKVPVEQNIVPVSGNKTKVTTPVTPPSPVILSEQVYKEKPVIEKKKQTQQTLLNPLEAKDLNKHITRAQLALGVEKLEPYGEVYLPLLVNKIKAEGLFYYTEVNNIQGSTVFHEWVKDGKTIYKHKFNIRTAKGRLYTSKLFSYFAHGQWQVRIITQQGKVLHKIDFSVQQQ